MAVHVEELSSSVAVEPGPGTEQAAAPEHAWKRLAHFAAARDRQAEDERRISAERFDD